MLRFLLFLIGFGFSIIGFIYIIMYLNYLNIGYSFVDYVKLLLSKIECYLAPIGILLLAYTIIKE